MEEIIRLLHEGNYSCVIANNGEVRTFTRRGVADLHGLLTDEKEFLRGAMVADKVVGKAAAALMALGGVQALHADIISSPALALLEAAGVRAEYSLAVPFIRNRAGNDWCPLEKLSYPHEKAEDIFPLIDNFVKEMAAGSR